MFAILALTSHLIMGFTPGEIYTVLVDDVPQMEVQVSAAGMITFDTQTGTHIQIGLPKTPTDPDEPDEPDDPPAMPPAPAHFGVTAAPSPTSGPLNVLISIPDGDARQTRVDLFDATGRRVGNVSAVLEAPGTHRIAWNTGTLESGLYFVRAQRGGEERVTRVLVVR